MTQVVDCNNKARRNTTIDFFKCVACILVIINHFHHDGLVGSIEVTVSHLGVPLFFMVSGYQACRKVDIYASIYLLCIWIDFSGD